MVLPGGGQRGHVVPAWSVCRHRFGHQTGSTLALDNDRGLRCGMVHFLNWSSSKDHHSLSMMPLRVLCGLVVLMWPGTGLMSETCVAMEGHIDVHPWSMMQPEAKLVSMGRATTGVHINVSGLSSWEPISDLLTMGNTRTVSIYRIAPNVG